MFLPVSLYDHYHVNIHPSSSSRHYRRRRHRFLLPRLRTLETPPTKSSKPKTRNLDT